VFLRQFAEVGAVFNLFEQILCQFLFFNKEYAVLLLFLP
jgi:hypothetical protein